MLSEKATLGEALREVSIEPGRVYEVGLEITGTRVCGYVEGVQVAEMDVEVPAPGRVGVVCARNETNDHEERVRVGQVRAWRSSATTKRMCGATA